MIIIVALLMVGFLGVTDFLTGAFLSFSIFYLIPVLMTSWTAGRFAGIFMSLVAAAAWLVCDFLSGMKYPHFLILYWNTFVRLCFFVISAYLLSSLRDSLEKEKELSSLDPLTGLENSRSFFKHAEME
ncbi:MAG: GGDEF domain-containing protein, partial [bacterium]